MKEDKKVLRALTASFKTLPGIIFKLSSITLILMLIGIFIDSLGGNFCSYNPTRIPYLAQGVALTEIEGWSYFLIPFAIALLLFLAIAILIGKGVWRNKPWLLILLASFIAIFCIASHFILNEMISQYVIADFPLLTLDFSTGYYLTIVGLYLYAVFVLSYSIILRQISKDKIAVKGVND